MTDDRAVLHAICDHVAAHEPYRKTTIGDTSDVVHWAAAKLGWPRARVERALKRLFETGHMSAWTDDHTGGLPDSIGITSDGWETWSRYSPADVERSQGRSVEEWREWDGFRGKDDEYTFKLDEIWD